MSSADEHPGEYAARVAYDGPNLAEAWAEGQHPHHDGPRIAYSRSTSGESIPIAHGAHARIIVCLVEIRTWRRDGGFGQEVHRYKWE